MLLRGEKFCKLKFCDNCILGRQHRVKFQNSMHKSSKQCIKMHIIVAHSSLYIRFN
jgi:hypothetical protein